jgi:hypothetical protein
VSDYGRHDAPVSVVFPPFRGLIRGGGGRRRSGRNEDVGLLRGSPVAVVVVASVSE